MEAGCRRVAGGRLLAKAIGGNCWMKEGRA